MWVYNTIILLVSVVVSREINGRFYFQSNPHTKINSAERIWQYRLISYFIYSAICQSRWDTRSIFKWSKAGLNSEFSQRKLLTLLERRRDGFIPFPRVLAWIEKQTATSRFSTKVINSMFYNNNHYTKHAILFDALFTQSNILNFIITWSIVITIIHFWPVFLNFSCFSLQLLRMSSYKCYFWSALFINGYEMIVWVVVVKIKMKEILVKNK